jgi:predicted nucleotidyltransferase
LAPQENPTSSIVISDTFSPVLNDIVSRLLKGLRPERIYLFGSRASGKANQGSDYDLLVVVPRSNLPRHRREALSYDLLWGLTTPVDVIVLTRAEFKRLAKVKTSLAATAQTNGVLLYSQPEAK